MNPAGDRFQRNVWLSAALHAAAMAAVLVLGVFRGCDARTKPREITMFVDVAAMSAPAETALRVPEEVLRPLPPNRRSPEPPSKPKDIPDKIEKKPEKPKPAVERSTNRVARAASRRPAAPTADQIRNMLRGATPPRPGGASVAGRSGDPFPFAWYYGLVRQALYQAWEQPSGLSSASAVVSIRVEKDGRLTRVRMMRPSGVAVVDQSILRAVNSVSRLPPLPDGFSGTSKEIEVEFELTEGAL